MKSGDSFKTLIFACMVIHTSTLYSGSPGMRHLTDSQKKIIHSVFKTLDLSAKNIVQKPSVTFISAESKNDAGGDVKNKIFLHESKLYDLWMMRQLQNTSLSKPEHEWSVVFIFVFKDTEPFTSIYLEAEPTDLAPFKTPQLIEPRVTCTRCHASGPRLIRPKTVFRDRFKVLLKWNQKIIQYGRMVTPYPKKRSSRELSHKRPTPLNVIYCQGCHSKTSKVRGPLDSSHLGSIAFLMNHHTGKNGLTMPAGVDMPPRGAPNPKYLRQCISDWSFGKPLDPKCTALPEESLHQPIQKQADGQYKLDSTESQLVVSNTSFGKKIIFKQIKLTGFLNCSTSQSCSGKILFDLTKINSHNFLRDYSIKKNYLSELLRGQIEIDHIPTNNLASRTSSQIKSNNLDLSLTLYTRCRQLEQEIRCRLFPTKINMGALGIKTPELFGLRANPTLTLQGDLYWRR